MFPTINPINIGLIVARGGILSSFVVKSTEGATLVSQNFRPQLGGHESGGDSTRCLLPLFSTGKQLQGQIDLFLKTVKLDPGDLPAVLDLETKGGLSAGELCDRAAMTELSDKVIANIKVF